MTPVSKTKFQTPQLSFDYLPRTRLVQSAAADLFRQKLTLISAPAGAGKTTLAASIIQKVRSNEAHRAAWLRLDASDNDPHTFITAVILALQTAFSFVGNQAAQFMQDASDPAAALQHAMTLLINDLHTDQISKLVVVLDDYYAIEAPLIHNVVDYWLAQLPPHVHLMMTTRYDPPLALARLRMRGQLAEIRLQQLRFKPQETEAYLHEQLEIDLSGDQLAHLQDRTEGWIAGLRLLAMTLRKLQNPAERDAFITQFSRSNQLVFDLLAEEVLAQQPPEMRDFLLKTSVLAELTPELCTAVAQTPTAPQLLVEAYKRNLFLTATDPYASTDTAYRYHDLFADLLRRKLQEQGGAAFRAAHERAAQAHPDPIQAIEHYLQTQAWQAAIDLIVQQAIPQLRRRHINQQTLRWIAQLPEPAWQSNPWLQLVTTYHRAQVGDVSTAVIDEIMVIRDRFRADGEKQGEYLSLLAAAQSSGGYFEAVLEEVRQFFHDNPEIVQPEDEMGVLLSAAWGAEDRLDWDQLTDYLGQMFAMWQKMPHLHYIVGQGFGLPFYFSDLGIAPIARLIDDMYKIHGDGEQLVHLGIYNQRSTLYVFQAKLDEAAANARIARRIIKQLGHLAWQYSTPDGVERHTYLARGDYASLHKFCQERFPQVIADPSIAFTAVGFLYVQALAYWQQAQPDKLQQLVQNLPENISPSTWDKDDAEPDVENAQTQANKVRLTAYLPVKCATLLILGWTAVARQQFAAADKQFKTAVELHKKVRHTAVGSHPRLDLACLHWLWFQESGDARRLAEAENHLAILLVEVAQREMPGLLLFAGRVVIPLLRHALPASPHASLIQTALSAFGEPDQFRPIPIPNSQESLTPREAEVLHLLVQGASNRDIAEKLVITTRTAKAHVSSILQKLGVSSRSQAVAVARDLSLL